MVAIRLHTIVGKDRRLVIDLPPDTPIGPAELVILPQGSPSEDQPLTREEAQARLIAGGALSLLKEPTDEHAGTLSQEEIWELGTLPPGSPQSHELIDEDRGPR